MQTIRIVIPVYREADNLVLLYERLEKVIHALPNYSWEYMFVNDGSPDNSWEVLSELASKDTKVKVLDLSRNFGKEIALTAGVHLSKHANAVICMDADLQHPPELILKLILEWENGAEIVATVRTDIEKQPMLRKVGSHLYYWLMSRISGLRMVSQTTDFRLYDKKVINAFCQVTERERMFRGIMDWMGFRKVHIEFKADARNAGEVGYSYTKLWQLAINSITAYSLLPLRLTGYIGILITVASSLLLIWMLLNFLIDNEMAFTPIAFAVVVNTFLIGLVLVSIGLVAIYIGTIHTEVVNRPLYLIRSQLNIEDSEIK